MPQDNEFSIIVTGGASGIGKAVCTKLASRGINVLVADIQEEQGKAVAARLSSEYSVDAVLCNLDVTKEESVQTMAETAAERWGRIDYAADYAEITDTIYDEEESITSKAFDR